jgi:superfamily II DNA or RNA helicase
MTFRPYQSLIYSDIIEGFKSLSQQICVASMGAGKSLIIAKIAEYYSNNNKPVVILTNVSELIPQLIIHLKELNLNYGIIKSGYDIPNDFSQIKIWLIMEQSFYESKRKTLNIHSEILLKDEFHIGFGGKRYTGLIDYFKPSKILGFTGTPFDENGYLLDGFTIDNLILHGEAKELTDLGFLVPLKYYSVSWAENKDYSNVKSSGSDYSSKDLDTIINTFKHNSLIVKSMNEMNAKSKKTLVYCNSIEQAEALNLLLKKDGYKSATVHSKNNLDTNNKNISNFDLDISLEDSIDCLVSVSKLTTGFNQPKANLLVLCRPTKILRLYLLSKF